MMSLNFAFLCRRAIPAGAMAEAIGDHGFTLALEDGRRAVHQAGIGLDGGAARERGVGAAASLSGQGESDGRALDGINQGGVVINGNGGVEAVIKVSALNDRAIGIFDRPSCSCSETDGSLGRRSQLSGSQFPS